MDTLKNILVVLGDHPEDAGFVLDKARTLAAGSGARVHAVRVVYEGIADLSATAIDTTSNLKSFILEAEETVTEELVESSRAQLPDLETATLWNSRLWEGVLHAAEQTEADLIVKGTSRHSRFGDVVRTPDDWNLLRSATVPVMLVKPQAWVKEPAIVCALDAFDPAHDGLNTVLLKEAEALTRILDGSLHLVVAYPLFERWVGELGALRDYDELKQEIEKEIRNRVSALAERVGVRYQRLYADEGRPDTVIGILAGQLSAELVVVGTHARQGLKGMLLGNTSERLVYELETDVVTVHGDDGIPAADAS